MIHLVGLRNLKSSLSNCAFLEVRTRILQGFKEISLFTTNTDSTEAAVVRLPFLEYGF